MAESGHRYGVGAFDVAHKVYRRFVLADQKKRLKCVRQYSTLPAGLQLNDSKHDKILSRGNAADAPLSGVSRDSYATVGLLGADGKERKLAEYGHDIRLEYFSNENRERTINGSRGHTQTRRFPFKQCASPQHLCRRRGLFVLIRAYSKNGAQDEALHKSKRGYYDILKLSPDATQAQIKTAYYKQSFLYHPDRNAGSDEATLRFSNISEAYTVLGNKGLRKKYDLGLLSKSDLTATARPSAKGSTERSSAPPSDSRRSVRGDYSEGGVFDFDKFFKSHYSEQLQRERDLRVHREKVLKLKEQERERTLDMVIHMGVGVFALLIFYICLR
ncbi:uncharacterized protein ACBR49_014321 [Aulostomus maculatus]